jgi:hypothetical protein
MKPLGFGVLIFMFWLLVMGVKPKQLEARPLRSQSGGLAMYSVEELANDFRKAGH